MIAPWLFELLRRERDWRATLAKLAVELSDLADDRVRGALDLGAAFEHLEPQRRHAITAYQLAGPGRDRGRSLMLATEMGWWPAVGRLAHLELKATGSIDALIMTCRELMNRGTADIARRLCNGARIRPSSTADLRLAGLRAEIEGHTSAWPQWVEHARAVTGADAADVLITAARLARSDGQADWRTHLRAALAADPLNAVAAAMLTDVAIATNDRKEIIDLIKVRFSELDCASYCNALRVLATRLMTASTSSHGGLARRLLTAALERAYRDGLGQIPGHLAMWATIDAAAAQDGRRAELLPLLLRGLDGPIPGCDRVWLAALGAAICAEAGNHDAARSYAAVVAEEAPSHPIVLELLAETRAAKNDAAVRNDLDLLKLDGDAAPALETVVPADDQIDLAPLTMAGMVAGANGPDPRYVDVSVPVLDDVVDPRVAHASTASTAAARRAGPPVKARSAPPAPPADHAPVSPRPAPNPAAVRASMRASVPVSESAYVRAPEPASKAVSEPAPEAVSEPASVRAREPAPKPVAAPASARAPEPAPKAVSEPGSVPAPEPAPKRVAETPSVRAPEPAPMPVSEPPSARAPEPARMPGSVRSAVPAPIPTTTRAAEPAPVPAMQRPRKPTSSASAPRSRTLSADWTSSDLEPSSTPPDPEPSPAPLPPRESPRSSTPVAALAAAAASATSPVTSVSSLDTATPTTATDDSWGVDEQLFLPRRRSTQMPLSGTAKTVSSPGHPDARAAPSSPRPDADAFPPTSVAPPRAKLIPTAALHVLQSAGSPRALPKIPPLNARPRAGRVGVAVDMSIRHEGRSIDVHTRDVSITGFFAITSVALVIGTVFDCELRVPVNGMSEQAFSARARVVRRDLGGYGFVLVEPPPALVDALAALGAP